MTTCPCGFTTGHRPGTAAWHRAHRAAHMLAYPRVDEATRQNLDRLVRSFEELELAQEGMSS